jgi:tetratricopeptide (TPR) repeat protein
MDGNRRENTNDNAGASGTFNKSGNNTAPGLEKGPKRGWLSIISLVLALISPLTLGILALPSLVLGLIALRRREGAAAIRFRGAAIAGVVISSIILLTCVAIGAYLLHDSLKAKQVEALRLKAHEAAYNKQPELAFATYVEVVKIHHGHWGLAIESAIALLKDNRQLLERNECAELAGILRKESDRTSAWDGSGVNLWLVELLYLQGDYKGVVEVADKKPAILIDDIGGPTVFDALIELGRYKEAIALTTQPGITWQKIEEHPWFGHNLGRAYLGLGDYDKAIVALIGNVTFFQKLPPCVFWGDFSTSSYLEGYKGFKIPSLKETNRFTLPRADTGFALSIYDASRAYEGKGDMKTASELLTLALRLAKWEEEVDKLYSRSSRTTDVVAQRYPFLPRPDDWKEKARIRLSEISRDQLLSAEDTNIIWQGVAGKGWGKSKAQGSGEDKIVPTGF